VDLLDLQAVDPQTQLLKVLGQGKANVCGQLLAVVQHVFHGHSADDGAQVAGEQLVNGALHDGRVLVQEPAGGVGDAGKIVSDLVRDDPLDSERDGLVRDGVHDQARGAGVQAEATDRLEAEAVQRRVIFALGPKPGDDQGLVRLGDTPYGAQRPDQDDDDANCDSCD